MTKLNATHTIAATFIAPVLLSAHAMTAQAQNLPDGFSGDTQGGIQDSGNIHMEYNLAPSLPDMTITGGMNLLVDDQYLPYLPKNFNIDVESLSGDADASRLTLQYTRRGRDINAQGGYYTDGFRFNYGNSFGRAVLTTDQNDADLFGYVRDHVTNHIKPYYDDIPDKARPYIPREDFNAAADRIAHEVARYIVDHPEVAYYDVQAIALPDDVPEAIRPHLQQALDQIKANESITGPIEHAQDAYRNFLEYERETRNFEAHDFTLAYTFEAGTRQKNTEIYVDGSIGLGFTVLETDLDELAGYWGPRATIGTGLRHDFNDHVRGFAHIGATLPLTQYSLDGVEIDPDPHYTAEIGLNVVLPKQTYTQTYGSYSLNDVKDARDAIYGPQSTIFTPGS